MKYLAEVVQLERNMPPFPRPVFADAEMPTVVMLVSDAPWGAQAFLTHHEDAFTEESLQCFCHLHGKFSLGSVDRVGMSPIHFGHLS